MLDTSARLLRLLSLFQAQRYWSGADLSQRLEITARTLRRDVDRLRSLGYPVHSTPGAAGGYQLGAGATLPPLLLDDDEAVAVAVGLRTAASASVAGIEEASVRALARIEQLLPSRLRHRVTALHAFIVPLGNSGPLGSNGPTVGAEMLSAIAGACRDCEKMRFRYNARNGVPSTREVEPHRLVHTGRRWYLAAWDLARRDWRTFRVDRIEGEVSTGSRFVPREPPEGDFALYVSRSVVYSPYPYRARVTLHAGVEAAIDRVPAGIATFEAVDSGRCVMHVGAGSLDSLSVYLALIGFEFEVHEPPELIERVRWLAARFGRACERTGSG